MPFQEDAVPLQMPNGNANVSERIQGSHGPYDVPLDMWPGQNVPQDLPQFELEREETTVHAIQ